MEETSQILHVVGSQPSFLGQLDPTDEKPPVLKCSGAFPKFVSEDFLAAGDLREEAVRFVTCDISSALASDSK